jgi:hypothetical protein
MGPFWVVVVVAAAMVVVSTENIQPMNKQTTDNRPTAQPHGAILANRRVGLHNLMPCAHL